MKQEDRRAWSGLRPGRSSLSLQEDHVVCREKAIAMPRANFEDPWSFER
jgi:hypothetical protein